MAKIFLSYAHEDQAHAQRIVDALAKSGLEAWWDHQIPPGSSWDDVIGKRIEAAGVVIVIWSKQSVASNFVKEEAQIAYDAGKLLPVKVDEIEPPMGFRRVQAADLVGWRGDADNPQWRATLEEVRGRLSGAVAAPRPAPARKRNGAPILPLLAGAAALVLVAAFVMFRGSGPSHASVAQQPAPVATTQPVQVPSLAGFTCEGTIQRAQPYTVRVLLLPGGDVELRNHLDNFQRVYTGWTWRQNGAEMTLQYPDGSIYRGAVANGVIEATFHNAPDAGWDGPITFVCTHDEKASP
jgi:hypothetical protein